MSSGYVDIPPKASPSWKFPVSTASLLPSNGNNAGDARVASDTGIIYVWTGAAWVAAGGGGGGNPAGADGNVQFNSSSAFGANALFQWDDAQDYLGIQQATPAAPLHVTGALGQRVTAPNSLAATLVQDIAVDSPVSYTTTQVNAPSDPGPVTTSLVYIEPPVLASAAQGAGIGYIATGQTITYRLYSYRLSGSILVVNPTYYQFTYTDPYNDGRDFNVDCSAFATLGGLADGFVLWKQDDQGYGPYWIDLGNVASYTDSGYTNQDPYQTSAYVANGSSWSVQLAQYQNLGAASYRTAYITDPVGDNSSGYSLIIHGAWGVTAYDGYIVQNSAGGQFTDIVAALSFDDWGQAGSVADLTAFSAVAFPHLDSAITPVSSAGANQNDLEPGTYTATGASYYYAVYDYVVGIDGIQYVSAPYNFVVTDNGDAQPFSWDISLTDGVDPGAGHIILVSLDGGLTYPLGADIGAATSAIDSGAWGAAPDVSHAVAAYTGLTRNFSAYGYIASPLKYSSTPATSVFTDSNPVGGYLIQHDLGASGNADNIKINESSYRSGAVATFPVAAQYFETNSALGDPAVTPSTIGYLATGQVVAYSLYAFRTINGQVVYSAGHSDASVTFPNDSNYYVVDLTYAGSTSYKAKRIIDAGSPVFITFSSGTFEDNVQVSWSASSTLTPTTATTTSAIFERSMDGTFTDPAIATFRNTNSATGYQSLIEIDYNTGSAYASAGKFGVQSSGNFFIDSQNHGLEVGAIGTPHTRFQTTQAVFNLQGSSSYEWILKGLSIPYLLYGSALHSAMIVGNSATSNNFASMLNVAPIAGRQGVTVTASGGGSSTVETLRVESSGATKVFGVDQLGRVAVGGNFNSSSAQLTLASGDASTSQLSLNNTTTLPSTPVAGGIERYDNNGWTNDANTIGSQLLFTDKNNHRYSLLTNVDPGTGGAGLNSQFWRTGANGMPQPDSGFYKNSSGTIFIFQGGPVQFKNGAAIDTGQNFSVGGNFTVVGGVTTTMQSSTSGGVKFGTATNQKWAFWNATPIVQPVNTVALDTLMVNFGIRASGGVANFDTDIKAGVVGKGLYIKEGSNATMGLATLSAGSAVVSTAKVTANSRIFLTAQGGTVTNVGAHYISARTAGTSFTIASSNVLDASDVAWMIVEPA